MNIIHYVKRFSVRSELPNRKISICSLEPFIPSPLQMSKMCSDNNTPENSLGISPLYPLHYK
jgi:hypothetical protein